MTYITAEALSNRLPQRGGALTQGELEAIIDDRIAQAEAEYSTETAYSRMAVAKAARADALEVILVGEGVIEAPIVTNLREEATLLFDKHDAMGEAPGEAGAITPNLVSNAVPGLFNSRNFFPGGIIQPLASGTNDPWSPWQP